MKLQDFFNQFTDSRRIVILGIGSELCGDDSAGMLCAELLKKEFCKNENVLVIAASTAPENFTGEICDFRPDALFMIDAADLGMSPGEIAVIDVDDIQGISFSTHMLPLSMLVQYLHLTVKCKIGIIGIQFKNKSYGDIVCPEVQAAVGDVVDSFIEFISSK